MIEIRIDDIKIIQITPFEETEHLVRKVIELTAALKDGAWKGRIDDEDIESLVAVITERGKKSDYERLEGFGLYRVED